MGFLFTITCLIFSLYETGLEGKYICSSTGCYIYGAFYIIYHLLDNCDGKQARNLKLSSPLGFFMDHNLDSFSLICMTITGMNVLHFETPLQHLMLYISTSLPFYSCTWEEYTTGHLEIPYLSGVDEGAYLCAGLFIFTGYVGQDFLNSIYFLGVSNKLLVITLACSFGIILAMIR
jgi:phosphatidylglycerophosphate synthase